MTRLTILFCVLAFLLTSSLEVYALEGSTILTQSTLSSSPSIDGFRDRQETFFEGQTFVVALGGNAFGKDDFKNQKVRIKETLREVFKLKNMGAKVVLNHGNGPQVGILDVMQSEILHDDKYQGTLLYKRLRDEGIIRELRKYGLQIEPYSRFRLAELIVISQYLMAKWIAKAWKEIANEEITFIPTHVLVDENAPELKNEKKFSKFIGKDYPELIDIARLSNFKAITKLEKEHSQEESVWRVGFESVEGDDSLEGYRSTSWFWIIKKETKKDGRIVYRRVVPSPKPKAILHEDLVQIRTEVEKGRRLVVFGGGGGIPIVSEEKKFIDVVIDKDEIAKLVASDIEEVDGLAILTAVTNIFENFGIGEEVTKKPVYTATPEEIEDLLKRKVLKGGMVPKGEVVSSFVKENPEKVAIVTIYHRLIATALTTLEGFEQEKQETGSIIRYPSLPSTDDLLRDLGLDRPTVTLYRSA